MTDAHKACLSRQKPIHWHLWAVPGVALSAALIATCLVRPLPRLVWNVSPSAPIGLYSITPDSYPQTGDMVLAKVPEQWRQLGAQRRYIPINVPLVKRAAAEPGDIVCAVGREIFVNGRGIAGRRRYYGMGRPLPWWNGCTMLRNGALLLLMDNPSSFDGRYFGPTQREDIIGRARLIWRR
mgnify:CR=1 FL=1